jgi:hypothetical protein
MFNMARDLEAYLSFCDSEPRVTPDGLGGKYYRPAGKSILLVSGKVKNAKLDCEGEKIALQSHSLASRRQQGTGRLAPSSG